MTRRWLVLAFLLLLWAAFVGYAFWYAYQDKKARVAELHKWYYRGYSAGMDAIRDSLAEAQH